MGKHFRKGNLFILRSNKGARLFGCKGGMDENQPKDTTSRARRGRGGVCRGRLEAGTGGGRDYILFFMFQHVSPPHFEQREIDCLAGSMVTSRASLNAEKAKNQSGRLICFFLWLSWLWRVCFQRYTNRWKSKNKGGEWERVIPKHLARRGLARPDQGDRR